MECRYVTTATGSSETLSAADKLGVGSSESQL